MADRARGPIRYFRSTVLDDGDDQAGDRAHRENRKTYGTADYRQKHCFSSFSVLAHRPIPAAYAFRSDLPRTADALDDGDDDAEDRTQSGNRETCSTTDDWQQHYFLLVSCLPLVGRTSCG
jgi:hypothetical protein